MFFQTSSRIWKLTCHRFIYNGIPVLWKRPFNAYTNLHWVLEQPTIGAVFKGISQCISFSLSWPNFLPKLFLASFKHDIEDFLYKFLRHRTSRMGAKDDFITFQVRNRKFSFAPKIGSHITEGFWNGMRVLHLHTVSDNQWSFWCAQWFAETQSSRILSLSVWCVCQDHVVSSLSSHTRLHFFKDSFDLD